jgi:hypothetical protein
MRTTVTLDPDVAAQLKQVSRERGVSFKAALNDAVRSGLSGRKTDAAPYSLPARWMGVRPGIDLDRALRLAGELEDVELMRKLELRK